MMLFKQEKWAHVIRMLVDERGPWSTNAFPNSMIKRWKLDKTEDLWRRRLKLKRNYHFSEHLCHPSDISSTEMGNATDVGTSIFGSDVPEKMKRFLLKGIRGITEDGNSETYDIDSNVNDLKIENSSDQVTDQGKDTMEDTSVTARTETNEVLSYLCSMSFKNSIMKNDGSIRVFMVRSSFLSHVYLLQQRESWLGIWQLCIMNFISLVSFWLKELQDPQFLANLAVRILAQMNRWGRSINLSFKKDPFCQTGIIIKQIFFITLIIFLRIYF